MHHMARAVKPILGMIPPDPTSLAPSDLEGMLKLGGHLRSMGAERFHALYKLMTMSSADYLDEWFEFDPLKATKSASGIIGTFLGPRSPGSAYVLLHHYMGEIDGAFRAWGFCKGGTGAVSNAIAAAARAAGATMRTEAPVKQVLVKNGRATGVVLENGEEIARPDRGLRVSTRAAPSSISSKAASCRTNSSSRCAGSASAARRARSTSRCPNCRTSPACPASARSTVAPSRSARAWSTWSAPTTTPSTASSRGTPTWTSCSRR